MKHIQHTEQLTFQKFVKTSKRDSEHNSDNSSKRNSWNKKRSFKRDMLSDTGCSTFIPIRSIATRLKKIKKSFANVGCVVYHSLTEPNNQRTKDHEN